MSIGIDFTVKVLRRKTFIDRVEEPAEAEDHNIHIWDKGLRVELRPMGNLYIS